MYLKFIIEYYEFFINFVPNCRVPTEKIMTWFIWCTWCTGALFRHEHLEVNLQLPTFTPSSTLLTHHHVSKNTLTIFITIFHKFCAELPCAYRKNYDLIYLVHLVHWCTLQTWTFRGKSSAPNIHAQHTREHIMHTFKQSITHKTYLNNIMISFMNTIHSAKP